MRCESSPFAMRTGGTLLALAMKGLVRTLDVRIACYDDLLDPAVRGYRGPAIYVIWHEYLAVPPTVRRGSDAGMLISQHRDANIMTQIVLNFGFKAFQGSSTRGGAKAILEIMRLEQRTSLVITPDGPRGPRRQLSTGCVYLAGLLGMPIVPLGCGLQRPWRSRRSWDQFALPWPGTRARMVLGPAIAIPPDLDKSQLEAYRVHSEQLLVQVTTEAEAWANDGKPRANERPAFPVPHGSIEL